MLHTTKAQQGHFSLQYTQSRQKAKSSRRESQMLCDAGIGHSHQKLVQVASLMESQRCLRGTIPTKVTQKELFKSSQYSVIAISRGESKHLLAQPHHQLSFKAVAWFRWKVFNKQMRIPLNSGIQLVPKDVICMLQLFCETFPRWPDSKKPSFTPWRWLRASVLIPRLLIYHHDRDFVLTPARLSVTSKVLPSFPQSKQAQLKSHCFYKNISPPYGLLQEFFSLSSTVNIFYPYGTTNKWF